MKMSRSQYVSGCSAFLSGSSENCLPKILDSAYHELAEQISPAELIKLQIEALKHVLSANPKDLQCLDRFSFLIEKTFSGYEGLQALVKDLLSETEDFAGNGMHLPALKQHLEESKFMINSLAEITENLDNQICQLLPCQVRLSELQQISHTILQNADFGVLVLDESYRIKMVNKTASGILGIPENVQGCSLEQVLLWRFQEKLDILLSPNRTQGSTTIVAEIKGEIKTLEIETSILLGKRGKTEGWVLIIHDITSKEKAQKVMEENLKLAMVGHLAAGVAHEIKNPLTVIKGFSQLLLRKTYEDPQVSNFLAIIAKEVDGANLIIQDFLNLGKQSKPRKEVFEMCSVIESTIALIESQCFINGIEIDKQLDCPSEILADPHQIQQVLINLAKNSMEAMEGSIPTKQLSFIARNNIEAGTLLISVKDSGCGIPEDRLEKVKLPFFTTKKYGTGLGLNVSKDILEQHGGQLSITSDHQGTTATIELPLHQPKSNKRGANLGF